MESAPYSALAAAEVASVMDLTLRVKSGEVNLGSAEDDGGCSALLS
jgi:hypothetical protein